MASLSEKMKSIDKFNPNLKYIKASILNYLLRNISLYKKNSEKISDSFLQEVYGALPDEFIIPQPIINHLLEKFLTNLKYFRDLLRNCKINWSKKDSKSRYRHIKIYIHKVHRLAPIFDYKRACINLEKIHKLFELKNFWPHLTTQLALVIFITDRKSTKAKEIQQNNLRALCNCSAYAFHRTRNILELDKYL
jgi:hypothetical protein